jgi:hypothetical protein
MFDMVADTYQSNLSKFSYEPENEHYNNFKFAVIVPHTFIDETGSGSPTLYESFSYSFTQNRKKADPQYMVQTYTSIEFSPMTMVITKSNKPLSKFLISLCAIVGGVFVMFGILNSFIQSSKRTIKND